jgi:hypothetical protein
MPRQVIERFEVTQAMLDATRRQVRHTVPGPFIGKILLRRNNTVAVQYPKRIPRTNKQPVLLIRLEEVTP